MMRMIALLLLLLAVPAWGQTSPGSTTGPPLPTTVMNAVTTNTTGSPVVVQFFGALLADVTITGGTVNLNVKGRIDSSSTYRTLTGINNADGSTITTITASGSYVFPAGGMYDVVPVTSSISGATVTVKFRAIPSVGRALPSSGSGGVQSTRAINTTSPITGGGDFFFSSPVSQTRGARR
ncbi:MAG TPA: hypothetical protein VKA60_23535 [Blastocatellia bacterium]|nr:hypothetical protein [Blastocatellia bacterium]